ncbi:MAG: valine--tRNA ligase [Candidatus Yanofskybacteria bacterium CG10_big_fil_rev_8_21_14_0_10_46_23]|uniref:Valine--tRNA ligase n=1 Tax=Candidatus Yanofskybacteria bacterium CG10_big_fil_rev_8_21_14_0_10_46_23 TaxID=1975098 RepID=A0A2H0R437_9BACT|nr:MAG: valine--tRNA ligase [Candidatus Yanofskybacteria bacterium CG10_big_fil_rev_8_21_14_0_10_46_23]
MPLEKTYSAKENETKIYKLWEESGFFNPDNLPGDRSESYSIVLPPPNVTGTLHMGHAAMLAIEDSLIRYQRMRGKKTLWLPGTDHAAIATQEKVEKQLYKEKKTRHDFERADFLRLVDQFAQESHDTIVSQIKRMGASIDWSREAFTLDAQRGQAVFEAFKRMFEGGLIYRGERIVNWDPRLQTTVSDDELEWREEKTPFYYLKYGPFTIGTARPETKFGDKYVVMHPDDKRYTEYEHGQKLELEWINGPVTATIIKDPAIDPEFGSGVMTITPWHDSTDFEIAQRHNLDKEQIIDSQGKLLPIAQEFSNQHISKARGKIVEKLTAKGLLEKVDQNYLHRVAINGRGGGLIEPQIMEQWFVDVSKEFELPHSSLMGIKAGQKTTLKKILQLVVKNGQIKILPERFEKNYFHWINNLRDWNISRQIWYGHRIPVWYRSTDAHDRQNGTPSDSRGVEMKINLASPGEGWEQDPDTLDTWFSSGLWTFSTLGWPNDTKDLENFHPTDVLETGYDILFFWVARMVLMSGFLLGEVPFKTVYLHGLVRDEKGAKMSKSLGNIIDPVDMAEKYGADATRLSLIIGNGPGNDLKLSEDKIRGYKHFANKIWNATRFVLMNTADLDLKTTPTYSATQQENLVALKSLTAAVTDDIENYRLYLAAEKLYHYFWHQFADKIIEENKVIIKSGSPQEKQAAQWLLLEILTTNLKLLHPFIPFVTEKLYQALPNKKAPLLMIEAWPLNQ